MVLDLQSLFGLLCTAVLIGCTHFQLAAWAALYNIHVSNKNVLILNTFYFCANQPICFTSGLALWIWPLKPWEELATIFFSSQSKVCTELIICRFVWKNHVHGIRSISKETIFVWWNCPLKCGTMIYDDICLSLLLFPFSCMTVICSMMGETTGIWSVR
jgi:hypothetical protein